MIRCLIVDDEKLATKVIQTYLKPLDEFEIGGIVSSATKAFHFISNNEVDLIFLDINMPALSGLDFLKSLKNPPLIIITTAYREYAFEGFELDVVDYLVKPIPLPRFLHALDKVKKQFSPIRLLDRVETKEKPNDRYVLLKVDKKIIRIDINDIYWIESLKDYIRVKTKIGDFITHQTLTAISELLPSSNFVRIHRSFTIALDKVNALIGNAVEVNGQLIPMSRNYASEVKGKILESGIKGS